MAEPIYTQTDGVLVRRVVEEDGRLIGTLSQPGRDQILNFNAELRKNPGALRKMEAHGAALNIPLADYYALRKINPDLAAPCSVTRTKAWRAFMASPESLPYRIVERV